MSCYAKADDDDDDGVTDLEKKLRVNESKGDYVRLECNSSIVEVPSVNGEFMHRSPRYMDSMWLCWWLKMILSGFIIGVLVIIVIKWVGPFFMNKEIIPIIDWEMRTFNTPMLALLIFASVALFPVILLPSTPAMWVAAMTFGYWMGFPLVMAGVAVGVSLPYIIGSLFYHKLEGWLQNHPEKASIIKLAGEGSWLYQCQAVFLIRVSPFPYVIFNYAAVATNVKYSSYICGSLVGMVPEVLVALYSGILIQTLADASQGEKSLSTTQIIINVVGFCLALAATVTIGVFAKKKLDLLQAEKEAL